MMNFKNAILALSTVAIVTSCSNDDDSPAPINEGEVITTFVVSLTPQGGGTNVTLTSRDADGDGPTAPEITVSGSLEANTVYNGAITLTNELETPAEDITQEVRTEGDEHQLFYIANAAMGTFAYTDQDDESNPIGLEFTWETADAVTGNVTFILRHEPNKTADGVPQGNITNAGGETDAEVAFNVNIQ